MVHISQLLGLPWWLRWQKICLQCRRPGFDPLVGKIPWRRAWQLESQFLGRLIRSPGLLRRREGSGALKVEIGVWNSQGGGKKSFFFSTFLSLSHIKHFFSLSPELMITQQTTQFKLCTKDYITTMYLPSVQFLLPENLTNPIVIKCIPNVGFVRSFYCYILFLSS